MISIALYKSSQKNLLKPFALNSFLNILKEISCIFRIRIAIITPHRPELDRLVTTYIRLVRAFADNIKPITKIVFIRAISNFTILLNVFIMCLILSSINIHDSNAYNNQK